LPPLLLAAAAAADADADAATPGVTLLLDRSQVRCLTTS
jgi:hypothetical protein